MFSFGKNKAQQAAARKEAQIAEYIRNWDKLSPAQRDGLARAVGVQPASTPCVTQDEAYRKAGLYGN